VKLPVADYVRLVGRQPERSSVLVDESERIAYVVRRLSEALDRPVTSPGSSGLAKSVMAHFQGIELVPLFAAKVMETLRDGTSHNRIAVSTGNPHAAVLFVAWSGLHQKVARKRVGKYLEPLLTTARRIVEGGIQIAGLLEIDAYLSDHPDPANPGRRLDEVFDIEVEYSYLPGFSFGSAASAVTTLPKVILLNLDLCSPQERQLMTKLLAQRT
jgi:hypothetical protein